MEKWLKNILKQEKDRLKKGYKRTKNNGKTYLRGR